MNFASRNRAQLIARLKEETFDLLVIGGGITGAGIALDAVSRGLKVALVEKNDFAYGTSSRSTKLIHGGLRYLKQLEFGLVKEVGSERAIVHNLAPHLVVPEKMLLPLYEKRGLGYWLTSLGLKIYDFLAGVKVEDQRKMLSRSATLQAEPLLEESGVKGGALYAEYRTDDARLTVEIIKCAYAHGAVVINYVNVTNFLVQTGRVSGVQVQDQLTATAFVINSHVVVNAAGPWVDQLRLLNNSLHGKRLHLTKGVHIVVPRSKLPLKQAIYFDVEDGRMIFAIPRGRATYVGTTDTSYLDAIDDVHTTLEDALYLLKGVNATFPSVLLRIEDIESSWAGLRPLIHEDGKSTHELSRKDEIFESASGLLSIAGGKLTGYRKMAERVVNRVVNKYFQGRNLRGCTTSTLTLAGAPSNRNEHQTLLTELKELFEKEGIPLHHAMSLLETFGTQCKVILQRTNWRQGGDPLWNLLDAQLMFCLEHEMVLTLPDFFVRRTGLLYFEIEVVAKYHMSVAARMKEYLAWTEHDTDDQISRLQILILQAKLKSVNNSVG